MAEKRYYWLKLKDDFFTSKRIKKLRKLAGGDTFTIIYLKMQLLSVGGEGRIQYTGLEKTFAEELALDLDEEPDNVAVTIQYLLACGLLETSDELNYYLPYTEANIGSETAQAQRQRAYRERQKEAKASLCNADVTHALCESDNNVAPPLCERYGEIEIEKEREIDTEIEKERKENIKRKERNTSTQPQGDCVLQMPLADGSLYDVPRKDVDQWSHLYPAVDVMQELRNMLGWLDANPKRRKTQNGIRRFINNWLSKTQNSGGTRGYTGISSASELMPSPPPRRRVTLEDLVEYPPGSGQYRPEWEVPNN